MSDQCKHCTLREQFYNCRQAECFQHENWYAVEMIKENDWLRSIITEALRVSALGNFSEVIGILSRIGGK